MLKTIYAMLMKHEAFRLIVKGSTNSAALRSDNTCDTWGRQTQIRPAFARSLAHQPVALQRAYESDLNAVAG